MSGTRDLVVDSGQTHTVEGTESYAQVVCNGTIDGDGTLVVTGEVAASASGVASATGSASAIATITATASGVARAIGSATADLVSRIQRRDSFTAPWRQRDSFNAELERP